MRIKNNYIVAMMLAVLFLFAYMTCGGMGNAYAAVNTYSGVIEDLEKDENFNGAEYVKDESDYSLNLFQIAESTAGELFIYVYQPSSTSIDLRATTVRLSQTIGDNLAPHDYKLTLIDSYNVFYKYKVDGLTVKSGTVRYYEITAIHRKYIDGKDDKPTGDNTINEVVFEVGQLWTICTLNGAVTYKMVCADIVEIKPEQKYCGYIRYRQGYENYRLYTDSFFVAFDCNYKIDALYEAEVGFYSRGYQIFPLLNKTEYFEKPYELVTLKSDTLSGSSGGWFVENHSWEQIESVTDFLSKEDLTETAKNAVSGKQWVLRYANFDYHDESCPSGREVTKVTILRLKFVSNGKPYNLGVVDNKQSGGLESANHQPDFWERLAALLGIPVWSVKLIFSVIILAILLPVLSAIFPVVGQVLVKVFKVIWWVICLPFKGIAALVRKIKGGD